MTRPNQEPLDRLAGIGAALPRAEDFMSLAPDDCPDCGATVWVTPFINWTAAVECRRCGWRDILDHPESDRG